MTDSGENSEHVSEVIHTVDSNLFLPSILILISNSLTDPL